MENIQPNKETLETASNPSGDGNLTKFLTIFAFFGTALGCVIVLYNLMFNPIMSALVALVFLFMGSTCAIIAAAKFLQHLDQHINNNDRPAIH